MTRPPDGEEAGEEIEQSEITWTCAVCGEWTDRLDAVLELFLCSPVCDRIAFLRYAKRLEDERARFAELEAWARAPVMGSYGRFRDVLA